MPKHSGTRLPESGESNTPRPSRRKILKYAGAAAATALVAPFAPYIRKARAEPVEINMLSWYGLAEPDMVEAFESTGGHLSLRLQAALEAGQAAGGDIRGMQSAAMLIVKEGGGVWLNNDVVLRLHVDDDPEPIVELRRLVEKAAAQRERRRRR